MNQQNFSEVRFSDTIKINFQKSDLEKEHIIINKNAYQDPKAIVLTLTDAKKILDTLTSSTPDVPTQFIYEIDEQEQKENISTKYQNIIQPVTSRYVVMTPLPHKYVDI